MSATASYSTAEWLRIRRRLKARDAPPPSSELSIVPLLDIVMNVMLFVLASVTTMLTSNINVPAPPSCASCRGGEPIHFTVKLTRDGFIVGAPQGYLQADCRSLGPATVTVPTRFGAHDFNRLTACLSTARAVPSWREQLSRQRVIDVAADGALPYSTLVRTLDATRETQPGARDLFDEPRLGIL
ncbi:MAG: hypothetical protein JNK05_26660 [Myxococcales bacterium]|nr:hypothetical protein [Myxococcales bacterium]